MTATPNLNASKRQHAYDALRQLLILQQLPQGQRLREPEWSERLGVHRSALREAFARLEAEGMIERGPQTGYFVPTLSDADLAEITRLRLTLEELAIDVTCTDGAPEPERLQPIAAACDAFDRFLAEGYTLAVIEADRRFHEALIQAAGMKRLWSLYQRASLPIIHRQIGTNAEGWRQSCKTTVDEHRQILEALSRGDADAAKHVLRHHLDKRSLLPMGV